MRAVFADTFYWIALLNRRDRSHAQAAALSLSLQDTLIVTTDEVLTEVLDYFSGAGSRTRSQVAASVYRILDDENVQIITQSHDSFLDGLRFYAARPDKTYSLIDCISMNVMRSKELTNVLTEDDHFLQEGFTILFREGI
jgi:predicted nucleic acid-binding protein